MVFEEQLIKTVRENPMLYDKLADGYNSTFARESAWEFIGGKIGQTDITFLKKRWRSLRDEFIKFYRIGKTQKNSRKKRWRYYDIMEFLIPHIEYKTPRNNSSNSTAQAKNSRKEYRAVNEIYGVEIKTESQESVEDTDVIVDDENSIFLQMEDDYNEGPGSSFETFDPIMETSRNSGDSDIHFLLSCASSLKRLSPRKKLLARIQIQKLLYEFEYGT